MHLCSAANKKGESWYRYAQIAKILGRSKASIVSYVHELVEIGLVKSTQIKAANGYNHTRCLKLLQWSSFLDYWEDLKDKKKSQKNKEKEVARDRNRPINSVTHTASQGTISAPKTPASKAQKTERSIQPTVCKDPKGPFNKIHQIKTHSAVAPVVWTNEDETDWKRFRPSDSDPLTEFKEPPKPQTIQKLKDLERYLSHQSGFMEPAEAHKAAKASLEAFAQKHRLKDDPEGLLKASQALAAIAPSSPALTASIEALEGLWKPYWRQMPTPKQIESSLKDAASKALRSQTTIRELTKVRSRLWVANLKCSHRKAGRSDRTPDPAMRVRDASQNRQLVSNHA